MKRIFLPIEIKVREFHGKLLLALYAAERGFETILGGQIDLLERLHRLGRGIYLDKSTAITKREWFRLYRALGNHVAAWDEEGLVYLSDEVYHDTRMDPEAFEMVDLFFAWGPRQARTVLARYPGAADRVVAVGNPRADILRPELRGYCDERVAELRRKHGRTILINTNFALFNYIRGRERAHRIFAPYPLQRREELLKGWREFQRHGYEAFREAAVAVHDRFPEHTVVVRPAPAENIVPWQQLFEGKPRGLVSKEGNVVEWIRAADAVVQFNCTTGVEAFLLDVPVIAYRCVRSEVYETPLPISCSSEAASLDELVAELGLAVAAGGGVSPPAARQQKDRAVVAEHLSALGGPTSCERILDEVERRHFPERPYTLPSVPLVKRVWRAWLKVVRRPDPMDIRVRNAMFPGLTVGEARSVADNFSRQTGRFGTVRITAVGKNIVRVGPS